MFVEKLSQEEVLKFALKSSLVRDEYLMAGANSNAIREFSVEKGGVKFSIGRIDFLFTDFDALNNYMFRGCNEMHNKEWIKFMYTKFGDDYKYAFYKFRTAEKRRVMNRVAKQFDSETQKYEGLFEIDEMI